MMKFFIQTNLFMLWMSMFMIMFIIMIKHMHPIMLMIFMIFFNMVTLTMMSTWKNNYLFSIITFLIMISGLLIIFMYFSSLVSNEKMKIYINFKALFLFFIIISLTLFLMSLNLTILMNYINYSFNETNNITHLMSLYFYNIIMMYKYPMNNMTILSILFILISFISIIKINSSSHSYPMRKIK